MAEKVFDYCLGLQYERLARRGSPGDNLFTIPRHDLSD